MDKTITKKINQVASWYATAGFYQTLLDYEYQEMKPFFRGETVLEIGPADGYHTKDLIQDFKQVNCIEASQKYCQSLRQRFGKQLEVHHGMIETISLKSQFETIIFAHVLEHIKNPVEALIKIQRWLKPGGSLILLVPNANSLHRELGVEMGLLKNTAELNDLDKRLGHFRVYTLNLLREHLTEAGFVIEYFGGVYLKPLSNTQMESLDPQVIYGFYRLGKLYPQLCADILCVCKSKL